MYIENTFTIVRLLINNSAPVWYLFWLYLLQQEANYQLFDHEQH